MIEENVCLQELEYLKRIDQSLRREGVVEARTESMLCSSIGTTKKMLSQDDAPNAIIYVTRLTCKVRSLGTNTYIGVGTPDRQQFRLISEGDSFTWIAPVIRGTDIGFNIRDFYCIGDQANGVLEISAVVMPRSSYG